MGRRSRRRDDGAVAVEAALVITVLLFPLLFGILTFGQYFWRAQRVDTLTPGVPEGGIAGSYGCVALKDEVAALVVEVVNGLNPELGSISVTNVVVEVLEYSPDVGVTVQIHIEVPNPGGLASLVQLPGGGALVTDFTQRLDDVVITDAVCR